MTFSAVTMTAIFNVAPVDLDENYCDGVYRKYFVKLPAIFTYEPSGGRQLKDAGVVNLERS